MKKTVTDLKKILGMVFCICAVILLTGTISVWADEGDLGKIVSVSNSKELKKAIDDPTIDTICLITDKSMNITIKSNENAKNKTLIIYALNTNITNKAVFAFIDIYAVCDYVENVSGNDITLCGPEDYHSFTVAKNKTVKRFALFSDRAFDDSYNKYILRKGAKIEEFRICYENASDGSTVISDFDKDKCETSIKYTDSFGENRSYKVGLDKDGRIIKMVSDKVFKFDYTFTYDSNGNKTGITGYDDDEGNFNATNTFRDNLQYKFSLVGDNRKNEESFTFDENGRAVTRKIVNITKDEESVVYYTYNYDNKGRLIYQYVDYGKDSYKTADYYTFNSKGCLVKMVETFYNPDGQQEGDSAITTYKYNKAGRRTKKVYIYGDLKETTKYIYDEFNFLIDKKVTTKEGNGRVEMPMTLEEFKEFNHLLFVENQQEKMFTRHTSQSVTYYNDFPLSADLAYIYYITPDSVYSEAKDWMNYDKDRLCYDLDNSTDPQNSVLTYIVGLDEDWETQLWRYMPTDESNWMDYERDQFLGAYKEDGKIHLFSRYNEDLSKEYAEETIGVEYKGESYLTETIFDEKTYDFLEMIITKEFNGSSEVVCRIVFGYDLPEPAACKALRCAFETTTDNMITATFVAEPGTKNEISKIFKIPVNSNVSYRIDDFENVEVYTDSKCEKPVTERWDKMSDLTRYFKHIDTE